MGLINSLYNGSGGRSAQILRSPTQAVDCEAVRKWHRRACQPSPPPWAWRRRKPPAKA